MSKRSQYRHTVSVEVAEHGQGAMLTWHVFRAPVEGELRKLWRIRRVLIRNTGPLSVPQLTTLAARMAAYVLSGVGPSCHVPQGLPWREPGRTAWSVPPGGGEGGASHAPGDPIKTAQEYHDSLTERVM